MIVTVASLAAIGYSAMCLQSYCKFIMFVCHKEKATDRYVPTTSVAQRDFVEVCKLSKSA